MANLVLDNDTQARRVIWGTLLGDVLFLALALVLIILHLSHFALYIVALLLAAAAVVLLWLHSRYSAFPEIRERRALSNQAAGLRAKVGAEETHIKAARQKREELSRDKIAELASALKDLQNEYMRSALASTLIAEADIPGIGPKLKARLAGNGFLNAADVNSRITAVEGFGQAKSQAMLDWHSNIVAQLNMSKPTLLPSDHQDLLETKYQTLHAKNDVAEARATDDKQKLEAELERLTPRLAQLAPYTFKAYISRSVLSQASFQGNDKRTILPLAIPVAGTIAIALCGLFGLTSIPPTAPRSTLQPAVDYSAISTSAMQTALASNASTLSAHTATPLASPTLLPTIGITPQPSATPPSSMELSAIKGASCIPANNPQRGKVVEIVDGDTIKVLLDADSKTYSVRYIGMDTPELNSVDQNFAVLASTRNTDLVYGKYVMLIRDVSETDRYGRLLRYVIADNIFVNYELVADGSAKVASYPPDTACIPAFQAAELTASSAELGQWGATRLATAPVSLATAPSSGGSAVCSCSGNLYNCGDFSSHASAQACYQYCISLGRGDIHRLDSDSDGQACESLP